jgi:hypothetical protein
MELQDRINVLIQGAEIAQKGGALTLDEAYIAKQAVDALKNNTSYKEAFEILRKIVTTGQKKGVYSLKDSYLLYMSLENYLSVLPQPVQQPAPQPVPQAPATTTTKRGTKKGE